MENYDVLIIGAATSGSFFAKKMAEKGYSVKVIEKLSPETLGKRLDIFHVLKRDFTTFGIPEVKEGDKEWAFEFTESLTISPYNNYPKMTMDTVVGMHMAEYILLMNRWAEKSGAVFEYSAEFTDFIIKDKSIVGIKYNTPDGQKEAYGKVVVDCSGTTSAARCKLPKACCVENFSLSPEDMFYVVLRYVTFSDKKNYLNGSRGWPYYKTWIAPNGDKKGGIIGIGACHSYDYAEEVYKKFEKEIPLPPHTVDRFERGTTPYTRPPYSFVGNSFIVTGDAACLTKPNNGEGVTSSMVHMVVAAEVLDEALKQNNTNKENLWKINTEYNKRQGADFVSTRAILTKAVGAPRDEFEYFFKKDIIFSEKFLDNASNGPEIKISLADICHIGGGIIFGLLSGKICVKTLKLLISGLSLGGKLKKHYLNFPESPDGYEEWVKKADTLWAQVGKMQ